MREHTMVLTGGIFAAILFGCGGAVVTEADELEELAIGESGETLLGKVTALPNDVPFLNPNGFSGTRSTRGHVDLTNEFTRQHPSVKWHIRQDQFAVITQNAPLTLSGPNAPDLMRLPQVSGLIHDHLLKNLDGYFKAYGWSKFPASQLMQIGAP